MSENPTQITEFLDQIFRFGTVWVYVVLLAACFIENIFPPFPGDSFIAAAAGLVALQRLDFLLTVFLILAGGLSSVMVLYYTGSNYGRKYFEKKNFKYFSTKDIATMELKLKRWGPLVLIFSRFLVGIRAGIAVAAGVARYPALMMFFYSTISYLLFTVLIVILAIGTVANLEAIKIYFTKYNLIVWPIIVIVLVGYFFRKFLFFRKETQ